VSENIGTYLGTEVQEFLGKNIYQLFREIYQVQLPNLSESDDVVILCLNHPTSGIELKFDFSVFRLDELIILEIIPFDDVNYHIKMINHLNPLITKLGKTKGLTELYKLIVEEVHNLTGFDRVMICRFDEQMNGSIVAQKRSQREMVSFDEDEIPCDEINFEERNLRFDHSLQIVADVDYSPQSILAYKDESKLEGSFRKTVLRSPGQKQLQYLKSMKIKSYLSISIIKDDKLWGLIVCHHFEKKKVAFGLKFAAQILGKVITSFIVNRVNIADYDQSLYLIDNLECIKKMIKDSNRLWEVLVLEAPKFFRNKDISSFVMRYNGKWTLTGDHLSKNEIIALVKKTRSESWEEQIYAKDNLLAINFTHGQDNFIMWFGAKVDEDWKSYEVESAKKLKRFIVEFELLKKYEEFEILSNTVEHFIWISAPDGTPVYYNKRWFEVTGLPHDFQDEQYKKGLYIHPDDLLALRDFWYRVLQTGEPSSAEMRIKDKHGNYRWVLNRIVPVKNAQGEIIKWYGSGTDIDNIKKIEQDLKSALSVRDEFISLASHELKTPITSLSLLLELTQRSLRKSKVVDKYMDRALRELRRLRFLVDELLDVSKISAGKMDVHFEKYDFCEIVYEVLERYQNDPRIQAIIEPFKERHPIIIECDKFRIEQVVTNLISNALKYGEEKPIEVSISEDSDLVTLSVRDFGLGISESDHKKIFERFERVSSQRGISGLGVGLYICKSIMDVHKGEIFVESEIGEGSTFKIKLWKKINH